MNANTVNVNTRYLQDVSYIRLKNLQFGYELPKRWISKIGLSKVSVYFSGENTLELVAALPPHEGFRRDGGQQEIRLGYFQQQGRRT